MVNPDGGVGRLTRTQLLSQLASVRGHYEAERGCLGPGASAVAVVAPDSLELVKLDGGQARPLRPRRKLLPAGDARSSRLSHVCWLGPHIAGLKVAAAAACSESRVAE